MKLAFDKVILLLALFGATVLPAWAQGTVKPGQSSHKKPSKSKKVEPVTSKQAKPISKETPAALTKRLAEEAAKSRAKLIEASQTLRASLAQLLELQLKEQANADGLVKRQARMLELGVIARRELEASQAALVEAQQKVSETNQQIDTVDQLVAEVEAAEQFANQPLEYDEPNITNGRPRVILVRYTGRNLWALPMDYPKVDEFFRAKFGRPLPVSAFGQTETHNKLGFDHSNALDVAVHPDSAEGVALQAYLKAAGVSFIAIRGAIAGSATGAHIHIGLPSKRLF